VVGFEFNIDECFPASDFTADKPVYIRIRHTSGSDHDHDGGSSFASFT